MARCRRIASPTVFLRRTVRLCHVPDWEVLCMMVSQSSPNASAQAFVELRGWKSIASFLGVGVTTAKNFADHDQMPVHTWGTKMVLAYSDALAEWRKSRIRPRTPRSSRKMRTAAAA